MRYNKQPTDITTQLAMLKQRGLIVSDEDTALKQLASISYFRLASSPSMPPVWKTLEVVSFGNLSKLYANMKDVEVKKLVAKSVGLPQYTYLESWMRSLTVLRNCCAHHARTWNRRYPTMPQLPRRLPLTWVDTQHIRPMKLYAQLCLLLYLEQSITPNSQIKDRLLSLLKAYPNTITRQMGFPHGWENEPLWQ